jgi:hypothetical protein
MPQFSSLAAEWKVLWLFLIPFGGGIPVGVLKAKSLGMAWPETSFLYMISDVILAFVFEPLMLAVIAAGKRSSFVTRMATAFREAMRKTTARYGTDLGPLALILIAFGVDPMTGRSVAAAAGHGFVSGWALAIAGDMLYFWLLMVSTLWMNSVLGDGTAATLIILVLMTVVPMIIKKARERSGKIGPG